MSRLQKSTRTWKTLSSRIVYQGRLITVREDQVIKPNNEKGIYSFVSIPPTVGIVPLDEELNMYLCKQFRYIFREASWEIPRGFVQNRETALQAAKRELGEEAKVGSRKIRLIGSLKLSAGVLNEEANIFLAENVFPRRLKGVDDKEIAEIKRFPFKEVVELIKENIISDGLTVGAILKVKEILRL